MYSCSAHRSTVLPCLQFGFLVFSCSTHSKESIASAAVVDLLLEPASHAHNLALCVHALQGSMSSALCIAMWSGPAAQQCCEGVRQAMISDTRQMDREMREAHVVAPLIEAAKFGWVA